MTNSIFLELRKLGNLLHRATLAQNPAMYGDLVTHQQMCVLGFIYENQGDLYQRDIEKHFSIRRSTATILLQILEEKGLIIKKSVESDARLKQIELTPLARELHRKMTEYARNFEQKILEGVEPEEQEAFISTLNKMAQNLEKIANKNQEKEKK